MIMSEEKSSPIEIIAIVFVVAVFAGCESNNYPETANKNEQRADKPTEPEKPTEPAKPEVLALIPTEVVTVILKPTYERGLENPVE